MRIYMAYGDEGVVAVKVAFSEANEIQSSL